MSELEYLKPMSKTTAAEILESPALELAELVDAYGEAQTEYDFINGKFKLVKAALNEAKGPVLEFVESHADPDEVLNLEGNEYDLLVSKHKSKVEAVDKAELIKIIGEKRFIELAEVAIGKIRAMLTEEEQARVLSESLSGGRTLKATKRG